MKKESDAGGSFFQKWSRTKFVLFVIGLVFIILISIITALIFLTPLKYLLFMKGGFPSAPELPSGYPNPKDFQNITPVAYPGYPSMQGFPSGGNSASDFLFHTRTPACVDIAKEYGAQLIYARPSDAPDRYSEISKKLKQWMPQANGIVNNAAEKFGVTADINVACNGNEISVLNIILPKTAAALNTHDGKTKTALVAGLQEQGYKDSKTKYIVYYDGDADGCQGGRGKCSGQFVTRGVDDRLSENNLYNSGPDYAILFDAGFSELAEKTHSTLQFIGPIGILHEFTHTLGAVQSSAPHSSNDATGESGHCNDEPPSDQGGNDIMCKSDIPHTTFTAACKSAGYTIQYDCNNDDYFNPQPQPGSYLATHWNIGSPLNRFIHFGKTTTTSSAPFPAGYPPPSSFPGGGAYPSYPGGFPSGYPQPQTYPAPAS